MSARILIVDDDAAIRRTLAEALGEEAETEVEVASSAEEALRVLDTERPPDLVLSDLRMRGLDGMDLLRLLRQRAPSSRLVMMTAYHDVGTAVGAMREGASDFLCKPFDLSTVRDVLRRLLLRVTSRPPSNELPSRHSSRATRLPLGVRYAMRFG